MPSDLAALAAEMRACAACADLPFGPRPIFQLASGARLMITSQAPGTRAHRAGRTFDDVSGDTLRGWLGVTRAEFYDSSRIAIVPMGMCYPGRGAGGDLPPRPGCAPLWQARVRAALPQVELTLLVGRFAQLYHLGERCGPTLADTVARWQDFLPTFLPTPHPSPRNRRWLQRFPLFETAILPEIRQRVRALLA